MATGTASPYRREVNGEKGFTAEGAENAEKIVVLNCCCGAGFPDCLFQEDANGRLESLPHI